MFRRARHESSDAFSDGNFFIDSARFLRSVGAGELHHHILDRVGIGNLSEDEAFLFGRSLDIDITEIENSRYEPINDGSHVLDAGKPEFTDFPVEEAFLFDIDDAFIRDDPNVEVVIHPDQKYI